MTGTGVSAVTATTAHREWARRPPDERFASVHALYEAARARRQRTFRTEALDPDDLALSNCSPMAVAAIMGHTKVDTTLNVYTQVLDGAVRAAADRVGSELFRIVQKSESGQSLTR